MNKLLLQWLRIVRREEGVDRREGGEGEGGRELERM